MGKVDGLVLSGEGRSKLNLRKTGNGYDLVLEDTPGGNHDSRPNFYRIYRVEIDTRFSDRGHYPVMELKDPDFCYSSERATPLLIDIYGSLEIAMSKAYKRAKHLASNLLVARNIVEYPILDDEAKPVRESKLASKV